MAKYRTLDQVDLTGKRVLLRAGFDVPMEHGKVIDRSRIEAIVSTMRYILNHGASLIILAHQGRPKGEVVPAMSQKPLLPILKKLLDASVDFADSCSGGETLKKARSLKPGQVLLLENVRFDPREKEKKDVSLAEEFAQMADIYVNDAFPNCHRSHVSMVETAKRLPSYMGLQLEQEVEHLSSVLDNPRRPMILIISGAKMETKIPIIEHFLDKGDEILLGGTIANTFIAARGFDIGQSKYETGFMEKARELMLEGDKEKKADIHVPRDAVVASDPQAKTCLDLPLEDIEGDMAIFDIGKITAKRYIESITKAGMVIWNGPLGMYEEKQFAEGSKAIAKAIAKETKKRGMISIIGGGDTIDVHTRYNLPLDAYTFASTGGGAMLEFVSGKSLPALEPLLIR